LRRLFIQGFIADQVQPGQRRQDDGTILGEGGGTEGRGCEQGVNGAEVACF
jgi:hypothetical protein